MNKFARFVIQSKAKFAVLAASAATAVTAAHAAVPADVTTALGDMKTDALTVGGVVLVAVISVFALKFIRKGI